MSDATGSVPPPASEATSAPAESSQPPPASSEAPPPAETSEPPPQDETTSAPPPPATSSAPPPEVSSSAPPPAESSSSEAPPSTSEQPPATSEPAESSATSEDPVPSSEPTSAPDTTSEPLSSIITVTSSGAGGSNVVITVTSTRGAPTTATTNTAGGATGQPLDSSNKSKDEGLPTGAKVAIGVVVPIVAIAILAIAGLLFWKKRKARMHAEEERRKEVEDYSYNPNADPTIPSVAMMSDNGYDMREDNSSGYRGWGNTAVGSTGRKASTTISNSVPYSDNTSPTYGNSSEARSGEPLMDSYSGDGEILGAMGPSAANNRGGDVHRGPSNASSSYSAAGRSDASDPPVGVAYGSGAGYYESYGQNPYSDGQRPQEAPGAPVIRDNPARRNTRIENASHFPQGSVGISQNF